MWCLSLEGTSGAISSPETPGRTADRHHGAVFSMKPLGMSTLALCGKRLLYILILTDQRRLVNMEFGRGLLPTLRNAQEERAFFPNMP